MLFSDDFKRQVNRIIAVAAVIGMAIFLFGRFDLYYELNDDVVIKDILAGMYSGTPETRNMQMLYPLSFLLGVLYNILPVVHWYALMLIVCELLCFYLILERTLEFCAKIYGKISMVVAVSFFWIGCCMYHMVFLQYTVTAGLLVATALFRFMTNYSTDPNEISFMQDTARVTKDEMPVGLFLKRNILNMLMICFAFLLRPNMALLLTPIVGCGFILKWAEESPVFTKRNTEKFLSVMIIVVAFSSLCFGMDKIAYSRTSWQQFQKLFDARTQIYDFTGIPSYEENASFYDEIGVSEQEVTLLKEYDYALSETIDSDVLQKISRYSKTLSSQQKSEANAWKEAFYQYMHMYEQGEYRSYIAVIAIMGLLVIFCAMIQKHFTVLTKMALLFLAKSVSWMYLFYNGRVVERVTMPLLFTEVLCLLAMLLMEFGIVVQKQNGYRTELRRMRVLSKWQERREACVRIAPVTALILFLLVSIPIFWNGYQKTTKEYQNREKAHSFFETVNAYCKANADNFYFMDVYSTTSVRLADTEEVVYDSEKAFATNISSFKNCDLLGGWISKSPLTKEKLQKYFKEEAASIQELLLQKENVYLVAYTDRNLSFIEEYYESIGCPVEITQTDVITDAQVSNELGVYQIRSVETQEITNNKK